MSQQHVVITGASAGIGEGLVRAFAAEGAAITLIARRREKLQALATSLNTPSLVVERDLTQLDESTTWLDEARATLGPVDVLINNAGAQVISPTVEHDIARGEMTIALNLLAPLRIIRAVLPGMVARGQGTIVNISSMAGLAPTPGMTYYNAGKAGLAGASEALRGELRGSGVNVVTVYPGIIPTELGSKGLDAYESSKAIALQPQGTTEGLAKRVVRAVAKQRARVIYPEVYNVARHMPAATRWFMDRFSPKVGDGTM